MDADATRKRAAESGGVSTDVELYQVVRQSVLRRARHRGVLVDFGCGAGTLWRVMGADLAKYVGVDVLRYDGFPSGERVEFVLSDLEKGCPDLGDSCADIVCCLETIEHVENPRALFREVVRLAKPGGLIVVTTPNQLSLASKISLLLKNEFIFFQERPGLYPSHLTALLEIDLVRMARENGLEAIEAIYTGCGRIPLSAGRWPRFLSARRGSRARAFSDNVILLANKSPAGATVPAVWRS